MKEGNGGIEIVVVQLPRGRTSVVGFDPAVRRIFTTHQGLFGSLFQHGARDLEGRLLFPPDGRAFLCAVYDFLFLNGYGVRWFHSARALDLSMWPAT
jgi:hypothetical protein